MHRSTIAFLGMIAVAGLPSWAEAETDDAHKQAAVVAAELATIAKHLQAKPAMALDFTKVSGEYCFNTWSAGGSHMSHYATDPSGTQEDVIDFVKVDSLAEAGIDVTALPRLPDKLGAMEPNTWYYLPARGFDPHHGKPAAMPLLVRASNLE